MRATAGDLNRRGRCSELDKGITIDHFFSVKTVGLKQLKARLSEYVRLVHGGETFLVTDRNEVVAELRPARRPAHAETRDAILDELEEKGDVSRRSRPKPGWTWKPAGLRLPAGTARRVLDEIRADRDGR